MHNVIYEQPHKVLEDWDGFSLDKLDLKDDEVDEVASSLSRVFAISLILNFIA